ncbi:MAG: DUF6020 family protein [Eubacteriales bacterium]|nr:DUF6020 family protein [Eubacteriales bacterium]
MESMREEHQAIWENILYRDKKSWGLAAVFGTGLSTALAFGENLERYGSLPLSNRAMWMRIVLVAVVVTVVTVFLWSVLQEFQERRRDAASRERRRHSLFAGWDALAPQTRSLLLWLLLMLCYFVVLMAVYPGFFVYDAQDELTMVETRQFTTHHPLFHVLLLGGVITGVHHLTGSYNLGIFCYSLLQMSVMAASLVTLLDYLRRKGIRRWIRMVSVLFFGFCPTVVMFVLCTAKDSLFSAFLLLLTVSLLEMFAEPEMFWQSRRKRILFLLSAAGMMLLRHNGAYAFLVFLLFLIGWSRGFRRKAAVLWGGAFVLFLAATMVMTASMRATSDENQEILTVPIQQLARTFVYNGEDFSAADREAMLELMPEEDWKRYTPKLSDPVKVHFNNAAFEEDPGKYLSLWLRMGVKHPLTYLNAWFLTSYGYWYPNAVIDCYRGNTVFTYTYRDSSYFGFETELPGERESRIPWLNELYRQFSLEKWPQTTPVVHLFFSPAVLFWLFAFAMLYCIDRGCHVPCRAMFPVFLVWLTVLLGPCSLVRYVVILWFAAPLFLAFLFNAERFR